MASEFVHPDALDGITEDVEVQLSAWTEIEKQYDPNTTHLQDRCSLSYARGQLEAFRSMKSAIIWCRKHGKFPFPPNASWDDVAKAIATRDRERVQDAAAETPHGVAPTGKSVAPDGEKEKGK